MAGLDRDTHAGRVRRLALLGRDEAGSPALSTLLDRLTAQGGYWHRLAQYATVAAGDTERLTADLSSESVAVRSFAYRHLVSARVKVDELIEVYPTLSAAERRRICVMVRRTGDPHLCERLVRVCRDAGHDTEAARLPPGCGPELVTELLAELDSVLSGWSMLGHRHPTVFLDYLAGRLAHATRRSRDDIWRETAAAVQASWRSRPETVLSLLATAGPRFGAEPVLGDQPGALVRMLPSETTGLLLHPESATWTWISRRGAPHAVLVNARALRVEDRLRWGRALRDAPHLLAAFLRRLAPAGRAEVFSGSYAGVDTSVSVWPEALLDVLPAAVRVAEAARMLRVRRIAEDPTRSLASTAFLAIAEARPVLQGALAAARAEDRAVAYQLLVACTRRSRSVDELGETLVTRCSNHLGRS